MFIQLMVGTDSHCNQLKRCVFVKLGGNDDSQDPKASETPG